MSARILLHSSVVGVVVPVVVIVLVGVVPHCRRCSLFSIAFANSAGALLLQALICGVYMNDPALTSAS